MQSLEQVLLLVATFIFKANCHLECFKCSDSPPDGYDGDITRRLCSNFDYSDHFVVDCPYSTMCMKKTFVHYLQNGEAITAELRDCAPQKYDYQAYRDQQWIPVTEVLEPYEEGCEYMGLEDSHTPSQNCYCRGYLCNSSTRTQPTQDYIDIASVVLVFNLLKYITSIT